MDSGASKSGIGLPLGRVSGVGLLHHLVNLLQSKTLGLGDEEVGVDESAETQTAPDEEDGRLHVTLGLTDHVRGDDGDDGIPQPVGSSRQTNTA